MILFQLNAGYSPCMLVTSLTCDKRIMFLALKSDVLYELAELKISDLFNKFL